MKADDDRLMMMRSFEYPHNLEPKGIVPADGISARVETDPYQDLRPNSIISAVAKIPPRLLFRSTWRTKNFPPFAFEFFERLNRMLPHCPRQPPKSEKKHFLSY